MLKPEYYTETEGGNYWIRWPKNIKFDYMWTKKRCHAMAGTIIHSVDMGGLSVFSLAFDDPSGRDPDTFLRWDVINGFNN